MPHRTLEIEEVAQYLNLGLTDVQRLVKDQDIPFVKHGGRLLFRKLEIDRWASPRLLGMDERVLHQYHFKAVETASAAFPPQALASDLLRSAAIAPAMTAKTKASVIREMARLGAQTGQVCDVSTLIAELAAREEINSTGLPGGLALLHPRHPESWLFDSAFLALGRTIQKVPFGSPDGRSTDLFFLIACPEPRLHLHVLARLCLMAQQTSLLENLRTATGAEEMMEVFVAAEQEALAKAGRREL